MRYTLIGFSFRKGGNMLEGLLWIAATYKGGYCVTFARGLDEVEILGRFVGDPARAWLTPDLVEDAELN